MKLSSLLTTRTCYVEYLHHNPSISKYTWRAKKTGLFYKFVTPVYVDVE